LGFKWGRYASAWEDQLSELADYWKIHGHCNVPKNYSKNAQAELLGHKTKEGLQVAQRREDVAYNHLPNPGIGKLWFRMGGLRHRLGRPFERACRLSENPRALQCSLSLQQKRQAGSMGLTPKGVLQVAQRREDIAYATTFRIQKLERLGFELGICITAWENRLSELANYREIHGHCNDPKNDSKNAKLGWWVTSHNPKETIQVAKRRKDIVYDHLPNPGIRKLGFRMGGLRHPLGRPFERACRLSENPRALQCSSQLQGKRQAG
jgi:hypothetical protein